jgi:cold shock CspA family protein
MEGTMIWFNAEKGFGFIRTEQDERLYVGSSGFASGEPPRERCGGRRVTFERQAEEGDARAVNVVFPDTVIPQRARLRHARGGSSR